MNSISIMFLMALVPALAHSSETLRHSWEVGAVRGNRLVFKKRLFVPANPRVDGYLDSSYGNYTYFLSHGKISPSSASNWKYRSLAEKRGEEGCQLNLNVEHIPQGRKSKPFLIEPGQSFFIADAFKDSVGLTIDLYTGGMSEKEKLPELEPNYPFTIRCFPVHKKTESPYVHLTIEDVKKAFGEGTIEIQ